MRNVSDLGWKIQSVLLVSFKYILYSGFFQPCAVPNLEEYYLLVVQDFTH